jgi:MFS family permease
VIFELPWVLAVQRYGANLVLAIAIVGWSAVTIGTGFCHDYGQLVTCRLLLGFLEAGLFPALTFLLSTTYPRNSRGNESPPSTERPLSLELSAASLPMGSS